MSSTPPNVLIILTDQLQRDSVGAYGNAVARTPHIDRLAADGVAFSRAYVPLPQCSPARASMFTGLYAHQHQLLVVGHEEPPVAGLRNRVVLPESVPSMGQAFKRAGYRMGYAGPWHMGDDHLPHHGWTDYWMPHRYLKESDDPYFVYLKERNLFDQLLDDKKRYSFRAGAEAGVVPSGPAGIPARLSRTAWTVDRGVEFLEGRDERPWVFCCSIKDPHAPVTPPEGFADLVDPGKVEVPESVADDLSTKPHALSRCESHRWVRNMTEPDWRRLIAHYHGLVAHVDTEVGRLLQSLDATGQREDTVVVFLADHGESMGAHRMVGKGASMYEESIAIPFMVHQPGRIEGGRMHDDLFSTVDFVRTMGSLCGVDVEPGEGEDFSKVLADGEPGPRQEIFSEFYTEGRPRDDFMLVKTIRTGRWKLNLWFYERSELYDLEEDPHEMRNRIDDPACAGTKAGLAGRILAWLRDTGDPLLPLAERAVERITR